MPKTIINIPFARPALLLLLLGIAELLPAQSTHIMKSRADESFQQGNYYNAAKIYAAVLYDSPLVSKTTSPVYPFQSVRYKHSGKIKPELRSELLYRLAESYRLYAHYKDALLQYEQYIASQDTRFPLAKLWYAECLLANDQPEKANTAFTAFLQKYTMQDSFLLRAKRGIANTLFAANQKKMPARALVNKMTVFSSEDGSNFALTKESSNRFLFTSSRHEEDPKKVKRFPVRLYSADPFSGQVEKLSLLPAELNSGTASISQDGLTLYVTAWKEDIHSPAVYYKLYTATRKNRSDNWSTPLALPNNVNVPGYHSKQPFVTDDNRYLLFTSDRPGGFGKFDIWVIELKDGIPVGTATNAGAAVNTSGEEASPFYDAATGELYFSSNGRVGMGGMDIYKVSGELASLQWKEPTMNLGYPFNSVKDDMYYTRDRHSDTAYLSSDRVSACCVEIFKAVALHYKDTTARQRDITGAKKVIPAIQVIREDSLPGKKRMMDSLSAITLNRMHVNYRFASARIRKVDHPQLEEAVAILKKDSALNILVASFTDCIGSKTANEILSRRRSESVKKYLLEKGIAPNRINLDFFGKKHPVLACREDSTYHTDQQMANRRSDLMITREKRPAWIPSGKELDIDHTSSYSLLAENSKGTKTDGRQNPAPGKGNVFQTDTVPTAALQKNTAIIRQQSITGADKGTKTDRTTSSYRVFGKNETDTVSAGKQRKETILAGNAKTGKSQAKKTDQPAGKSGTTGSTKQELVSKPEIITIAPTPRQNNQVTADSLRHIKITALVDPMPKLKKPSLIEQMTSRTPRKAVEVYTTSDSVKVELYDNGVFDRDSVSVIFNKELVVYKEELQTSKPVSFYVKLSSDIKRNEMIFFAENLGLTPPNSALMIITDGDKKRTEINVSSDLEHNAVIYFIKVKK